eukprot:TRINITY_DN3641_c0_g6_i3.p1 TRINITY_DN3641_c0_g6~~TRINITY_DN3641_c0_g6_i3.p1  ORF type:complete len:115 (+),score=37.02 TRINITY_DN3641_c0_g6_i3:46-345(+)
MLRSLVGSEMCIRDRYQRRVRGCLQHCLERQPWSSPAPANRSPEMASRSVGVMVESASVMTKSASVMIKAARRFCESCRTRGAYSAPSPRARISGEQRV